MTDYEGIFVDFSDEEERKLRLIKNGRGDEIPDKPEPTRRNIAMPPDLYIKLKSLAAEADKSFSSLVRDILEDWVAEPD